MYVGGVLREGSHHGKGHLAPESWVGLSSRGHETQLESIESVPQAPFPCAATSLCFWAGEGEEGEDVGDGAR